MEEEKYYTPSLDEFHVGFEFEMLDDSVERNTKVWCWSRFGNLLINTQGGSYSTDLKDVKKWIEDEDVRVKCLDRQDIEWEGWYSVTVIDGYDNEDEDKFVDGYELGRFVLHQVKERWMIYEREQYDKTNEITGNWQQRTLFLGTIRNISEFRKLLKQLGIK